MKKKDENTAHDRYTNAYIKLLDTYRIQIENSINAKTKLKDKFFRMIRLIMYLLIGLFIVIFISSFILFRLMIINNYQSVSVITGAITAMLSSFITMIVSLYKLPKIIAKYLFNKKEDDMMNEVMKNIQSYEIEAHKMEYTAALDAQKDILNNHEDFDDSPNVSGKLPEDIIEDNVENLN